MIIAVLSMTLKLGRSASAQFHLAPAMMMRYYDIRLISACAIRRPMKTLTLRGIDEELAGGLERLARQGRESMNGVILHLLRDKLGLSKPKFREIHHDLDDLAGTWTDEEAREFDAVVSEFSRIDEELWR